MLVFCRVSAGERSSNSDGNVLVDTKIKDGNHSENGKENIKLYS